MILVEYFKKSESRSSEDEEEQEAGFKDNLKTAGGAIAFLVAFIGFGAYFFRYILGLFQDLWLVQFFVLHSSFFALS